MQKANSVGSIVGMRLRGRFCASCQIWRGISGRKFPETSWNEKRMLKATHRPPQACRPPNENCSRKYFAGGPLEREWERGLRPVRLGVISVAHIYNLRKSRTYRQKRIFYQKTRPIQVAIGERRRPDPRGQPGYLRIDTVHQGDLDGVKGMYHINAIDEVTQFQVVGATAYISEAWLIPVLEAMLRQFPFHIRGFHSDNGSEFINHTVAKLLEKLLVEQTKSRPRHSNDNGLAETKNGAVIRKH